MTWRHLGLLTPCALLLVITVCCTAVRPADAQAAAPGANTTINSVRSRRRFTMATKTDMFVRRRSDGCAHTTAQRPAITNHADAVLCMLLEGHTIAARALLLSAIRMHDLAARPDMYVRRQRRHSQTCRHATRTCRARPGASPACCSARRRGCYRPVIPPTPMSSCAAEAPWSSAGR